MALTVGVVQFLVDRIADVPVLVASTTSGKLASISLAGCTGSGATLLTGGDEVGAGATLLTGGAGAGAFLISANFASRQALAAAGPSFPVLAAADVLVASRAGSLVTGAGATLDTFVF